MYTIKTPATSANLGAGFDTLGIAFNLYNSFQVEKSTETKLENIDEAYNNEDNLFLQAYKIACQKIGTYTPIHVIFDTQIPISRGLGSSASFITAGVIAASILHDETLSEEQIFQIAASIEGHPDNVAPCLHGGYCSSMKLDDTTSILKSLTLDSSWKFTALIPEFTVNTNQARNILPNTYQRSDVAHNIASAILTSQALQEGNLRLLKVSSNDRIHEPYRKTLIHDFDALKNIVTNDTSGVLLISGSGPTCLCIAKNELSPAAIQQIARLPHKWNVLPLQVANAGSEIRG